MNLGRRAASDRRRGKRCALALLLGVVLVGCKIGGGGGGGGGGGTTGPCGTVSSNESWAAPGDALSEWASVQVPAGTTDRLQSVPAPSGGVGRAFQVHVRDGDVAVNSGGQPIPGGWRAEGIGPTEAESSQVIRYEWNTRFDPQYPTNPVGTDGKPIWQVFAQWHQGDGEAGSFPPVAFIIENGGLWLDISKINPNDPTTSIDLPNHRVADLDPGQWHHFRVDVKWSLTHGCIAVWHDDKLIHESPDIATLYPAGTSAPKVSQPGTVYLKMGLYRKPTSTGPAGTKFVLHHDEVKRLAEPGIN